MGSLEAVELSECTSHLVEYAANRGLSRIPQMPRIKGSVLRYLPFFVLMGVGGQRLSVVGRVVRIVRKIDFHLNCYRRGIYEIYRSVHFLTNPVRLQTAPTGSGENIKLPKYLLKRHTVCGTADDCLNCDLWDLWDLP